MGKRKLHNCTYFQCDWTGLPMRASLCYMPVFKSDKLCKHGSYTCWEAVIAHAHDQYGQGAIDIDTLAKIQEHVDTTAGCKIRQAPHWSRMSWFAKAEVPEADTLSASTFFEACVALDTDCKVAVILHANGDIGEVKASPVDQRLRFGSFLDALPGDVLSFVSTRKKARDRDVMVFYTADATKPFNEKASSAFKMKIHGDVVVAQQAKELCYWDRTRYCNYSMDKFNEKRKREDPTGLSKADYKSVRSQMEGELSAFEGVASSLSVSPADLAQGSVIVPPDARELVGLQDPDGTQRLGLQLLQGESPYKMQRLEARLVNAMPLMVGA